MTDTFLNSSDSVRSARPLKHAQQVTFDGPLELEQGGSLPSVTVAYETYGRLTAEKDNAVLICHAISGDSHVARHDQQDDPGWWDLAGMVGPGRRLQRKGHLLDAHYLAHWQRCSANQCVQLQFVKLNDASKLVTVPEVDAGHLTILGELDQIDLFQPDFQLA